MSLKVTSRKLAQAAEIDAQLASSFDIYSTPMLSLIDKAWKYDVYGREKEAYQQYKGAAIFTLLQAYVALMAAYSPRIEYITATCPAEHLREHFKIDCIEGNLACLSKKYKVDYVSIWKALLDLYEVDLNVSLCGDCVGISGMIVDGDDDSTANIVGPCDN
jgi:hypothetical protein